MASDVVALEKSLTPSLRLVSGTLSRELKRTRELERELRSGLVSDKPGISSILVGVTINRTEAILAAGMEGKNNCFKLELPGVLRNKRKITTQEGTDADSVAKCSLKRKIHVYN